MDLPAGDIALAVVVGYLLGSIPFGLILTKLSGHGDVRQIGSGNIGATNVLRTGSKKLAAGTLLLDAGKAALACFLFQDSILALIAGFSAVAGHNFPVWLQFKGGKGVSASLGVWLTVAWPIGLLVCLTWLGTAFLTKYSSLAALVGLSLAPAYAYWLEGSDLACFGIALAGLAAFMHRDNIRRLLDGTESRIGQKRS
jgi:acyl phosphate:glycerol-3-phosphate acyltransferase